MNEKTLIKQVALRTKVSEAIVKEVAQAWVEVVVDSLKRTESVTIRNFGRFYIRESSSGTRVFKSNPSQRLRKLFGWSSTYKGSL